MKDRWPKIELGERSYTLPFNLSVMEEVVNEWGDLVKIEEKLRGIESVKSIKWLLTLLINEGFELEGKDERITEQEVGKMVGVNEFLTIQNKVFGSISSSLPISDSKNAPSTQRKKIQKKK